MAAPPAPEQAPWQPAAGFGPMGSGSPGVGATPVAPRAREEGAEVVERREPERGRPSYLVEGDDDEMFGNGDFTAPPVIGE